MGFRQITCPNVSQQFYDQIMTCNFTCSLGAVLEQLLKLIFTYSHTGKSSSQSTLVSAVDKRYL